MTPALFLDPDEIEALTGRRSSPRQIDALRRMGIRFYVNDLKRPVVPRSVIEGGTPAPTQPESWQPAVLAR